MPPRALASAISASLGIALLVHLNMQCMPYFNAIFAACKRGEAPAGIDLEAAQRYHLGFMCPVIRFLEDGAMNEGMPMQAMHCWCWQRITHPPRLRVRGSAMLRLCCTLQPLRRHLLNAMSMAWGAASAHPAPQQP